MNECHICFVPQIILDKKTLMTQTYTYTLQEINISHLGKRKIIFKMPFLGDMLVPWRVYIYIYLEPKWGPFVWPSNTRQRVEDPPPSTSVVSQFRAETRRERVLIQRCVQRKKLLMYIIISLYIIYTYIICIQLLPYFGILVSVFKFRAVQGVHWNNEIISNPNKDLWGLEFKGRTSAP